MTAWNQQGHDGDGGDYPRHQRHHAARMRKTRNADLARELEYRGLHVRVRLVLAGGTGLGGNDRRSPDVSLIRPLAGGGTARKVGARDYVPG